MTSKTKSNFLSQDIAIIFLSIIIALGIIKTDVLSLILSGTKGFEFFGSFIAGIFFTSIFTTAPAIATLGEIAHSSSSSLLVVSFFGALGAVVGDLFIFSFIKDRLSAHLLELMSHRSSWRRFKVLMRLKYFRWITFLVGGLIIVSPLPDELAISLFGFSKMKTSTFIKLSFFFNFVGICLIGFIARNI